MVALEAMARDADAAGERVQLLEARVADEMAPVPERQRRVRVLAQLVDEDGHRTGMVAQGGTVCSRNLVEMSSPVVEIGRASCRERVSIDV